MLRSKRLARKSSPPPTAALGPVATNESDPAFIAAKELKINQIKRLLRSDLDKLVTPLNIDFLTAELRQQFAITETANVSAHGYDEEALALIGEYSNGLILDCGAGLRSDYYPNVVNLEIVPYASTDVVSVGEVLPFKSASFDAVFSLNVLEHVRDPFMCAQEICRVLKPGGKLYCVMPFLQPLHAYPNHFFNASHQGLRRLFEEFLEVDRQVVPLSGTPIWTLTWILNRWIQGLPEAERGEFAKLTVSELLLEPPLLLGKSWVTNLPEEIRFELASTTALFGTRKGRF